MKLIELRFQMESNSVRKLKNISGRALAALVNQTLMAMSSEIIMEGYVVQEEDKGMYALKRQISEDEYIRVPNGIPLDSDDIEQEDIDVEPQLEKALTMYILSMRDVRDRTRHIAVYYSELNRVRSDNMTFDKEQKDALTERVRKDFM